MCRVAFHLELALLGIEMVGLVTLLYISLCIILAAPLHIEPNPYAKVFGIVTTLSKSG